ncbi:MAG: hypothetical protein JSR82_03085 [Verrucomicrobia bacterium]|nr:hypothetical protein [Verrucomicrobiota bacterium]
MKKLLIAFTLLASMSTVASLPAHTPASNTKGQPRCEEPKKCCLHTPAAKRQRGVIPAEAPVTKSAKPPEETWQEQWASLGSGG